MKFYTLSLIGVYFLGVRLHLYKTGLLDDPFEPGFYGTFRAHPEVARGFFELWLFHLPSYGVFMVLCPMPLVRASNITPMIFYLSVRVAL